MHELTETLINDKQRTAIDEFLADAVRHGATDGQIRHGLYIEAKPETRPGRGHDIRVAYIDESIVAVQYIDVYGNTGDTAAFGTVDWVCAPEDWCDDCYRRNQ